jgi:hypothetical protein
MEDNRSVIMNKFPSNQLIARIQMKSNKIFPLTLKPTKKKNATLAFCKGKCLYLDTALKVHTTPMNKIVCEISRKEKWRTNEGSIPI